VRCVSKCVSSTMLLLQKFEFHNLFQDSRTSCEWALTIVVGVNDPHYLKGLGH
jgi:hypothetical protein